MSPYYIWFFKNNSFLCLWKNYTKILMLTASGELRLRAIFIWFLVLLWIIQNFFKKCYFKQKKEYMCSKYMFKEKYSLCKKKHAKNSDMYRDKHLHAHYCFVWLFSEQVQLRTHPTVITAASRCRTSFDMKYFIYFFVNFSSIPQPRKK